MTDVAVHLEAAGFCAIAPPQILRHYAEHGTPEQRRSALQSIEISERVRARRELVGRLNLLAVAPASSTERRSVYDAHHDTSEEDLPGTLVRKEGGPAGQDADANAAYDGAGATYTFYKEVFDRESIDGRGMEIISSVHFAQGLDNAFWNGQQMVYGDGGELLQKLPESLDVCGHELTHGVTQMTARLQYHAQSGALNESMSDVMGSLVKQYAKKQTADQADWLIGEGTLRPSVKGVALRSMKAPGTAWEGDQQPANMKDYKPLPMSDDNGGVHLYSGIPNHAFYLAATAIGGHAWEKAGLVWYVTLTQKLRPDSDFNAAAQATAAVAAERFGEGGTEHKAVTDAWAAVGVTG